MPLKQCVLQAPLLDRWNDMLVTNDDFIVVSLHIQCSHEIHTSQTIPQYHHLHIRTMAHGEIDACTKCFIFNGLGSALQELPLFIFALKRVAL